MIDPLVTVVQVAILASQLASITAGRIASKAHFATPTESGAWPTPSRALVLTYLPGAAPDVSAGQHRIRVEALCYGTSQLDAGQVYLALQELCNVEGRRIVPTPSGNAMLYYLLLDGSPTYDLEPNLKLDFVRVPLKAAVHQQPL